MVIFAIDLKSFYASVECVLRGLDPLKVNLVVADESRTDKTICLAASPSLKSFGVPGRARLFEAKAIVKEVNKNRSEKIKRKLTKKSIYIDELTNDPSLEVDFLIAPPQMKKYIEYSNKIYKIYLKYFSAKDIHIYSVDEVFIDATNYLKLYNVKKEELVKKIVKDILDTTGITATAGIGDNLYLAKVAMDIIAKHASPDLMGCRVGYLSEYLYKKLLWNHEPLEDFWRIGGGLAKRLRYLGLNTMGDIARCSLKNEDILFNAFGVNAELIIDHAWGVEETTISDIKNYKSQNNSISKGQVLSCAYNYDKALIIIKEMAYDLTFDLISRNLKTNLIVINIGYDIDSSYEGEKVLDHYGRAIPPSSHGSIRLYKYSKNSDVLVKKAVELFNNIVDENLLVRRINIAYQVINEDKLAFEQLDLFSDDTLDLKNENALKTIAKLKDKFGKNAILNASDLQDGATQIKRNKEIGGHKA